MANALSNLYGRADVMTTPQQMALKNALGDVGQNQQPPNALNALANEPRKTVDQAKVDAYLRARQMENERYRQMLAAQQLQQQQPQQQYQQPQQQQQEYPDPMSLVRSIRDR